MAWISRLKCKNETDCAARLWAETRNASESDISQPPPSSDQSTHSSISDHPSSDLSTLSHSTINCPSSHSDDDDDNHNFPEDSLEPENNFDYLGHQGLGIEMIWMIIMYLWHMPSKMLQLTHWWLMNYLSMTWVPLLTGALKMKSFCWPHFERIKQSICYTCKPWLLISSTCRLF